MFNAFSPRDFSLIAGVLLTACIVVLGSIILSEQIPWAPYIPLGVIACGLLGWLLLSAINGSAIAIMLYLGAIAFITDGQFRVRGAGDISTDWQSAMKFLLWLGAGAIGVAHIPSLRTLLSRPACVAWLAYIVIAMLSSFYSPIPVYSFGCALALLCLFAFSFSVTVYLTESQILWTLLIAITLFNIGGWIVFFVVPDIGGADAWTISGAYVTRMSGLAGQATNLGAISAKATGMAFILWYTRRAGTLSALILGGFAFFTIMKSDTRTAEIATIAAIAAVYSMKSRWLIGGAALAATTGLIALQIFPRLTDILERNASRSGDPEEIRNLTGRLQIWDFSWDQITRSPFFGYGYNSSKVVLGTHIGFLNDLMVDSAHNLFLQNLLGLGIIGMIPLTFLLVYLPIKAYMKPMPIVTFTLVLIIISSISDSEAIGMTPTLMTVLFLLVSVWPGLDDQAPRKLPERGPLPASIFRE